MKRYQNNFKFCTSCGSELKGYGFCMACQDCVSDNEEECFNSMTGEPIDWVEQFENEDDI